MTISIVKNACKAVIEDDLNDLRTRLFEAQSLCRMLDHYTYENVGNADQANPDLEQAQLDIRNVAGVISRLIDDTHNAIEDLTQKTIDARMGKETRHA